MEPRKVELEIWKSTDRMWNLSVDGVIYGQSYLELQVRYLARDVKKYNPGINFVEVEVGQDDRENKKTLHLV